MKTIVQTGKRSVEVQDRPLPEYAADEALVRVEAAGVCGSDAHAYEMVDGYEWISTPRVMGHEYAGRVVETGSDVDEVVEGDLVVEEPTTRCGECYQCKAGQENVCQNFSVIGIHEDGAYAEYRAVDPEYLFRVPDELTPKQAAVVEPTSVAARAVLTRADVSNDRILVQGPGPIGTLTASIAAAHGGDVVVSGLPDDGTERLPIVEQLGLETVVVPEGDGVSAVLDRAPDRGFDIVFDATGDRTGIELASHVVRKGGQVVPIGLPGSPSTISMTSFVRGEVDIRCSYGYRWENFRQAVKLVTEGVIDVETMTESVPVSRPEETIRGFLDLEMCKPVFDFSSV